MDSLKYERVYAGQPFLLQMVSLSNNTCGVMLQDNIHVFLLSLLVVT